MSFAPRNVCITGGAGFIGANFVRHWLDRTREGQVVVLDALTYAGNLGNLAGLERNPRYVFVRADICDEEAVRSLLERYRIDTVVHFAAESHVDRSILGPDDFIRTNVVGTHVLLKAAKALWLDRGAAAAHRFHHVSTDEVYGSLRPEDAPFHESSPYAPNSPYSASKAGSDHLVRAYHETYGLDTTVTNCSNNYGPYQFPEKLIPLTLINILLGQTACRCTATGCRCAIGCTWRIIARRFRSRSSMASPARCTTSAATVKPPTSQVVRTLCALVDEYLVERADMRQAYPASPAASGKQAVDLITHVRDRPGHDRRYAIDFSKAARELGYAPARDLTTGLRATLDWYIANPGWWQALMGRRYSEWLEKNYQR